MIRSDDLAVFVRATDAGSFSAAARELGITPSLASNAVQRLEQALGQRLLIRSTRSLRLSERGERYLPYARAMLQSLEDGRMSLAQAHDELTGTLRLSAPSDLGRNVLVPWLDAFQAEYPRLDLSLNLSDRMADLFRQPLDLALRYGHPPDSSLVAQPLAPDNRRLLCASPAYLQRHGRPQSIDELTQHNCLRFMLADGVHERWRFDTPAGTRTVVVSGNRVSDDADVVRRWALASHGIVYKSSLDLHDDVVSGRLVSLLPAAWGEPAPLNLICAHRSLLVPAVIRLRDFLRERCLRMTSERGRIDAAETGR
jgi:DNA-binding transcriptional LysR family regulator